MNGLPTSLRLYQPEEEGLTYNPYPTPIGQRVSSALMNILNMVEQARQQQRQKAIIENILQGKLPEQWIPQPPQVQPAKSLLGKVLQGVGGIFDVRRPPIGITPVETAIAEARMKSMFPTGMEKYYAKLAELAGQGQEPPEGYEWGFDKAGRRILVKKEEEKPVWSKSGLTDLARNKILGVLKTGYYQHPLTGQRLPVKTKEQAINFILQQGYENYEEDPEIVEIIDKFPSETQQKVESKKGWFLGGQKTLKSPYPEYPDAFLEDGVWKVIRGGIKYRIEE